MNKTNRTEIETMIRETHRVIDEMLYGVRGHVTDADIDVERRRLARLRAKLAA